MAEVWVRLDLEQEEDRDKLNFMLRGWMYRSVLWDLDQHLRAMIKYQDLTEEQYNALQGVRDKLWELINEEGIDIE